ncbi:MULTISPECIES: HAD family hydrolase [Amycolatopsis methanolica group]|uniref:Haloacid dehalogenase domain-containing protein hydrolase n=1 Tax=Amycolatopsis methanolica 239 TaxID=1068978 RepID=A0A076MVL1_AMYME|nr:HAD-IB family phosphatase [Amycolatopsis methanolica]AIJ24734.1 haloacid dehalogenase domain-containing protein hydrolase [Amycolatopsis methanolica 239]
MDGTLLRSTATIELARQMGQLEAGQEIEKAWGEGTISDTDFWLKLLDICKDASPADFDDAFRNSPWMDGVAETFEDIRSRGEDVIVISQSPTFFVRGLEVWGANETYGSAVELGSPLKSSATLLPEAKVAITQSALAARNLSPDECVVYGDSSSDVALFTTYPHSVAVNPTPVLAPLAAKTYLGSDIREAHAMGRQLIATSTRNQFAQGSSS